MTEEETRPTFFGPIEPYTVFQQVADILSKIGYVVFIKLINEGWFGELRMPDVPKKEVEREES